MKTEIMFAIFVTFLFSTIAFAIPGIPHAFYGTVTVNNAPAQDGTVVTAKIDGIELTSIETSGGSYGYPIGTFYIDDPNNERSGKTITFFVSGADTGQTATFTTAEVTEVNLSATISTPTTQPSNGGGGGGSSGGGGGVVPTTIITTTTVPSGVTTTTICQEQWTCTDWSSCEDGLQTRTCTDENSCGTDLYKPFESQPCSTVEAGSENNAITGLFAGTVIDPLIALIVIIIIAVIIYLLWRMKKGKTGFKPKTKK